MKFHTEYHWIETTKHREYLRITDTVASAVRKAGVGEGMVLVSALHITAGVVVNDDDPGIWQDSDRWLEGLAPYRDDYRHHRTRETNADSHLKNIMVHHQVVVPVTVILIARHPGLSV